MITAAIETSGFVAGLGLGLSVFFSSAVIAAGVGLVRRVSGT